MTHERTEYPKDVIERILLNYPDLEITRFRGDIADGSFGHRVLILRCDMEMAFELVTPSLRPAIASFFLEGEGALTSKAVSTETFREIIDEMYQILNVEGLY